MLKLDEDAVICDLAETYGIYDYRNMPPLQVAIFCGGLRDNARIMLKMSGQKVKLDSMLLASIVDRLGILIWSKTKDGSKGRNKPKSILESINKPPKVNEGVAFETSEEFEKMKDKILKEGG